MAESVLPFWFIGLFIGAIVWLALLGTLFQHLRLHHPDRYRQMGSPSLFGGMLIRIFHITVYRVRGTQGNPLAVLRFIYSPEVRDMGDPVLLRLCQVMRILLLACLCVFNAFICSFLFAAAF